MSKYEKYFPYITGTAISVIFGLTFLFTKQGLSSLSPMVLLSYRFGVASVVLGALILTGIAKVNYKGKPLKKLIWISAFYPVLSFTLETNGLKYTSTSQAAIIIAIMPVFVTVLGIVFLKEKPGFIQGISIAMSVVGVLLIIIFSGNTKSNTQLTGMAFMLISVLSCSIFSVFSRKYSKYFTSVEITFTMICSGAVFFSIAAIVIGLINSSLYYDYIEPIKSAGVIVSVIYLGVFASVAAFFMFNYTLAKLPAANVSVFTNLATVVSIIAGILIMKENFNWYQITGGAFIILGVFGTNYFPNKTNKKVDKLQARLQSIQSNQDSSAK